jgi:hypothetical protein
MYFLDSSHIWHVAKSGSDSNGGHATQYPVNLTSDAKLTIGSAVSAASSGDTIVVWPGDYAENVNFAGKALTLIGANRNKSKIVPTSGSGIVPGDNSILRNLAVEAVAILAKAVDVSGKSNVVIEDCDLYGGYCGLYGYCAVSVFVRGCRIRGKYDGCNLTDAESLVVEGCIFLAYGTYSSSVDCRALLGCGGGTYSNCVFTAHRSDTTDKAIGAVYCTSNSQTIFKNCLVKSSAASGHTGQAYGILVNGSGAAAVLENCSVKSSSDNASCGPYDLWQAEGTLVACGCSYGTTDGAITNGGSGWSDAVSIQVDSALTDINLDKAAKVLVNKAVQDKLTGAITYYENDGVTPFLTHTPDDGEAAITRTPA